MEYQTLTGQDFRAKPELERLYKREREYFQDKFKVNQYKNELHACVIAPTYLNDVDFRYAWHLESIFQQEYANFRVIIIDDASSDKTSEKIARHLRWRDFPKEKAILIRSKVHRTAL
jgi:cellulose synthase/poly-beta-1,6-N-acetylglucosamine synthase-like glycosyltransferase